VCHGLLAVNILLHHTILVYTDCREYVQGIFITWINPIKDEANHNLLPCGSTLIPKLRLLNVDNLSDILHDTMQRACGEHLIFIVISDGDEELRMSVIHCWAQVVPILQGEFVGVAGSSSI